MDIEGAEVLALKGASKILSKVRKIIVKAYGDNLRFVEGIIPPHNFNTQLIDKNMTHIMGSKRRPL